MWTALPCTWLKITVYLPTHLFQPIDTVERITSFSLVHFFFFVFFLLFLLSISIIKSFLKSLFPSLNAHSFYLTSISTYSLGWLATMSADSSCVHVIVIGISCLCYQSYHNSSPVDTDITCDFRVVSTCVDLRQLFYIRRTCAEFVSREKFGVKGSSPSSIKKLL